MRAALVCALFTVSAVAVGGCSLPTGGTSPDDIDLEDTDTVIGDSGNVVEDSTMPDTTSEDTTSEDMTIDDSTPPPDSADTSPPSDTDDTMPPPDTAAPPDTGPTCSEAACGALPAGARRIALVDRTTACPTGFKQTDILEMKAGDACGCTCGLTKPTCPTNGTVNTYYSEVTSTCVWTGTSLDPDGPGCHGLGGGGGGGVDLGNYFKATPLPPSGGSCAAAPTTADKAALSNPRRICEPMTGCAGDICGGATGFTECVEGLATCGGAFPNARVVGTDVAVTCPACNCTLNAGKCAGTITFYGMSGCAGSGFDLAADDTCVAVPNTAPSTVSSFKYRATSTGAGCTQSFTTSPGTRTITGERRLCCR